MTDGGTDIGIKHRFSSLKSEGKAKVVALKNIIV